MANTAKVATPITTPAGIENRRTRGRKPGPRRFVAGLEAEHEARDADRQRVDHGELAGQDRVAHRAHRGQHGEHRRPCRLGDEQAGDALDVGDHAAPLGDHAGQGGEAVVEQHQLGHRPGGRRARPHGDAEVGVLQRERVVHAVAGHRHHRPARLGGPHQRTLDVRGHPTEHGDVVHRRADRLVVVERARHRPSGRRRGRRSARRSPPPCGGCRRRSPSARRSRAGSRRSCRRRRDGCRRPARRWPPARARRAARRPRASVGAPARSSTRKPWSANVATLAIAALSDATSTSGAPTYHTPSPPKATAVNLCAESNGMCSSTVQPGTSG